MGNPIARLVNSCSVALIVGKTVDVDLSVGRRVVGYPSVDGSVGMKLSVGGTVDAVSPMGGIVGADWKNRKLMGENLNHTAINCNMEEVQIWDLLLESWDEGK